MRSGGVWGGEPRGIARCYPPDMPAHIGYFVDSIASQQWFRCLRCQYDSFSLGSIRDHVRYAHSDPLILPESAMDLRSWIAQNHHSPLHGKRIGISFLTWNTRTASQHGLSAICTEMDRLDSMGVASRCFWVDNGSQDGTVASLQTLIQAHGAQNRVISRANAENLGQGSARNWAIGEFLRWGGDYLLMVDGDIEIVPYSSFAMASYLHGTDAYIGCFGMHCRNCTHVMDSEVAVDCRKIEPWMVDRDPFIAWTNYGVFRKEVLELCKFEENGPFYGPGWGFEDDDYQLQMMVHGYDSINTKYYRHLHRRRHSSVGILGRSLAAKVHAERKAYLLEKWGPCTDPGVQQYLFRLSNQTMPVLEY